jgi:hypothetical protein
MAAAAAAAAAALQNRVAANEDHRLGKVEAKRNS